MNDALMAIMVTMEWYVFHYCGMLLCMALYRVQCPGYATMHGIVEFSVRDKQCLLLL